MEIISNEYIKSLKQNNNVAKRVTIIHHIRNIDFEKFLTQEVMKEIKESDDEYSFRCQNILMKNADGFLDYMFNPHTKNSKYKTEKLGKLPITRTTPANFYLSHNPGEATIIFTSLTNDQQTNFIKEANNWANDRKLNLLFFAINGKKTSNACAEIYANALINYHSDCHCVFVTSNMAARSFSVPKIVNGIMMVNEPGYASAIQKYNRLSTIDWDKMINGENKKISHMYWFNFKSLNLICPLFYIMYNDLLESKKNTDIYGKSIKTMHDSINIFYQNDEYQTETKKKWEEQDIFNEIHKGIVKHEFISNHLKNWVPELEELISTILKENPIDKLNIKTVKIGKTNQKTINGGKSSNIIRPEKPEDDEDNTNSSKIKVSSNEIATELVKLTLKHEENDRDIRNFFMDCFYLFTPSGIDNIGKENIIKIWNIIETQIKNLKWNVN